MRVFSVLAVCVIGICLMLGASLSTLIASASLLQAVVNIDPNTLNLKSGGKWITVYVELPEPFNVSDIDICTILLDGIIPAVSDPKYGFVKDPEMTDRDNNGVSELMVKFDRQTVVNYVLTNKLGHMGIVLPLPKEGVEIELTIMGTFIDGTTIFKGSDSIMVIFPEPSRPPP